MARKLNKKYVLHSLLTIIVVGLSIFSGYFIGNIINGKYFIIDKYKNLNAEQLRDDISNIKYENKTPADFDSAIAFQIAEQVMFNSSSYDMHGYSTINTSAGITSVSITQDKKRGNTHYIGFMTYSSFVKTARQATFEVGGDIDLYEGTPTDETLEHTNWSDKCQHFTWESYYDYFGKHANRNAVYIVSTKTVIEDSGAIQEGDLYKFSLILDPVLSTVGYSKQIANNVGLSPSSIIFNKITITFWLDKNFKFVKQEKFESYTVPYGGISVTLELTNKGTFDIQ